MNRLSKMKKIIIALTILFSVFLAVIFFNFGLHVRRTQIFNNQERMVDNYSDTTDVLVDIHPRGMSTDSWEKLDTHMLKTIYAKIYEAQITNCSRSTMTDWRLKIEIRNDCWLNNAWNGKIEIHQFTEDKENVQTLSLQDYKTTELTLDYIVSGTDLLIPLSEGDYIYYIPNDSPSNSETTIDSNEYLSGEVLAGFIFYSADGNVNLSHYELQYKLYKNIWEGTEPMIFMIALPLWFVLVLLSACISVFAIRYEGKILKQSRITIDFLDVITDFVDSKENQKEGHSRKVAKCARMLAHELGMKKSDCENVYYAALVHDIGKCYVPDYILTKKEKLSPEEMETLKSHTIKGAEMLKKCSGVPHLTDGALYHHERYDGTGYPYGKNGENIPLIGRIVCLSDAFANMKAANKLDETINEELSKNKGIIYDPMLVDVLLDAMNSKSEDFWNTK